MRTYGAIVRHALGRAFRVTAGFSPIRAWLLALAIGVSLPVSALGPAGLVRADPSPDPAARLQVVISKIHINNDRDGWASGELSLYTRLCPSGPDDDPCTGHDGVESRYDFSADSGDDVYPNIVVPGPGTDQGLYGEATDAAGLPVYADQFYVLRLSMQEQDTWNSERMGKTIWGLSVNNNWGIGVYTQGSDVHSDGAPEDRPDFVITYEVRRVSLPDPRMQPLQLVNASAGGQLVCGAIENVGLQASGPVPLTIRANGTVVRQATRPALEIGQSNQECIKRSELPPQQVGVSFGLDEAREMSEMNEANNIAYLSVAPLAAATGAEPTVPGPAPAPSPQPKPSTGEADLTVKEIRLNGSAPDGKDDCRTDPTNVITVVVKNGGTGDAGRFTTRLMLDKEELDQSVEGIRAGEEREVIFERILLKKGEHTFKAIADPAHGINESKDNNNERKVSARCTDAS